MTSRPHASAKGGESLETTLCRYIEQQLRDQGDEVRLGLEDDLVHTGFDSIGYVRLLAYINDRFGIDVPDVDVTVDQFGTVGKMATYLRSRGIEEAGT